MSRAFFRNFLRSYKSLDDKLKVVPHSGTIGWLGILGIGCTLYTTSNSNEKKVDKIAGDVIEIKEVLVEKTEVLEEKFMEVSSEMKISVDALTESLKPKV